MTRCSIWLEVQEEEEEEEATVQANAVNEEDSECDQDVPSVGAGACQRDEDGAGGVYHTVHL